MSFTVTINFARFTAEPAISYDPVLQLSTMTVSYVVGTWSTVSGVDTYRDVAGANIETTTQVVYGPGTSYTAAVATAKSQIQTVESLSAVGDRILSENNKII